MRRSTTKKKKMFVPNPDPYFRCLKSCTHDLVPGVLVEEELLKEDGPDDGGTGGIKRSPVMETLS